MTTKFNLPTIRMDRPAQIAAFDLAVRLGGWEDAVRRNNRNGIIVWGKMLLTSIELTGIELRDPSGIRAMMHAAECHDMQTRDEWTRAEA